VRVVSWVVNAIESLAGEIGPRPACSTQELRAARWCASRLESYGYEVDVEQFRSRRGGQIYYAAYFSMALVAALLIVPAPLVAVVVGATALVLYARDADGRPVIGPRGGLSCNVFARPPYSGRPRLIVVAHVDSARSSLSFNPRRIRYLRASVAGLNVVLIAIVLLGGVAWIAQEDGPGWLWIAAAVAAAFLVWAIFVQVHSLVAMPAVSGANDNASGVEVLLRLASEKPHGVWFLVTGSAEAGMIGIQNWIKRHPAEAAGARWLNLEGLGAGRVVAATEEGIVWPYRSDRAMVAAAQAAGARAVPFRNSCTDATALLARGRPALSLLAIDKRGLIPHRHWVSDAPERVRPEVLERATEIARAVVRVAVAQDAAG
jgi:Peptidase family M28